MNQRKKRAVLLVLLLLLIPVLLYAVFQILKTQRDSRLEEAAYRQLLIYRPEADRQPSPPGTEAGHETPDDPIEQTGTEAPAETKPPFVNDTIVQLQADHPNALGWVTVPGTRIDYPVVQGADNDYFLHRDVDGNYLYAGVPFLDYRCAPDFSGGNAIIYGHNMKNGTMFNALSEFQKKDFFEAHREIIVYLRDRTVTAEAVACLVINPNTQEYVYAVQPEADHLTRLLQDARIASQVSPSVEQRFLTLSTCGYEFNGARIVLVGIIREEYEAQK